MESIARIAVGGFQHETNTFAPSRAGLDAFQRGGAWPPFAQGQAMLQGLGMANLPAAGAIAEFRAAGYQIAPLAWAAASPSGPVTDLAYETITGAIIDRLLDTIALEGPVAGVYLDLHGAMVTESFDDGEGELLRRVRRAVGARVPIVASLDWHANVSDAMVQFTDALVGYRTYPHVDMAETGARASRLLCTLISHYRHGNAPVPKLIHRFDWLTPLPAQCSTIEPARSLCAFLAELEQHAGVTLTLAPGFPMADIPDCGMSIIAIGARSDITVPAGEATPSDPGAVASLEQTSALAHALAQRVCASEADFSMHLYPPDEAVAHAMAQGVPGCPVVLADTQDNPGAGGNGDTTGLLAALIAARANHTVFGLLIDSISAAQAHAAGVGQTLEFALGERSGLPGHVPLSGSFQVEALANGQFTCTGAMFSGFKMNLGLMARLRSIEAPGVTVLLASNKCQTADRDMMRVLGIEPSTQAIIALKSSVHFRADFEPIARAVLVVRSPGPALADPADFPWTRLRRGMRLRPLGPVFQGPPNLLLDVGNSFAKWALVDPQADLIHAPNAAVASGRAPLQALENLADQWRGLAAPGRITASCVASPAVRREIEERLSAAWPRAAAIEWIESTARAGVVQNSYRLPAALGTDRWAALIGARELLGKQAVLIAMCGTATTVDLLTEAGVFKGGVILPGLSLMRQSLHESTAGLPPANGQIVNHPDCTADAIASGCIHAQVGAIERLWRLHRAAHEPLICLLAGGAARLITPWLTIPHQLREDLVLVGLERIASSCTNTSS
jgi:pantothenate kinase type III